MDNARKWTDQELEKMIRKLNVTYAKAKRKISKEYEEYMERGKRKLDSLYSKSKESPEDKKRYQEELELYTIKNQKYRQMIAKITDQLANTNQTAIDYLNGKLPAIYTKNYNQAESLSRSFNIINENTVKTLATRKEVELPYKKLDIPADKLWNKKKLNAQLLQGIIQGDSIYKLSKRIEPIVDQNKAAAVRNARTMVTGAENAGRIDSHQQLKDKGINVETRWMSTSDGRTRDWHRSMNGQIRDGEYFTDGNGRKIRYPGDPQGHPGSVYNCRCTVIGKIVQKAKKKITDIFQTIKKPKEIPDETWNAQEQRIIELEEQYGAIGSLGRGMDFKGLGNMGESTSAYVRNNRDYLNDEVLAINTKLYKDEQNMLFIREMLEEAGYLNKTPEKNRSTANITHEYGHILQNAMIIKELEKNPTYLEWAKDNMNLKAQIGEKAYEKQRGIASKNLKFFYEYGDATGAAVAAKTKDEILTICEQQTGLTRAQIANKYQSAYSKVNDYEFFAEAFQLANGARINPLGKAMKTWLKKEKWK